MTPTPHVLSPDPRICGQHTIPTGHGLKINRPRRLDHSSLLWPLYAERLPPQEQQYYTDRGRPPGVMQVLPNIAALTEYSDSSSDILLLTCRLREWRRSGSSNTLYISTLCRDLHHWYLQILPSHDNDNRRASLYHHRTTAPPSTYLDQPNPTQPNPTQPNPTAPL